jgi:hypothetical protein
VVGRSFSGAIASLLVAALVTSAYADFIPPCAVPDGVTSVLIEHVPPALMQTLKERIGEIVLPNDKFDATDVRVTGRNRRFIFVWNAGKRWVVATEHGGRGYNDPIFAYDLGEDGRSADLIREGIALFPATVCAVASDLIAAP